MDASVASSSLLILFSQDFFRLMKTDEERQGNATNAAPTHSEQIDILWEKRNDAIVSLPSCLAGRLMQNDQSPKWIIRRLILVWLRQFTQPEHRIIWNYLIWFAVWWWMIPTVIIMQKQHVRHIYVSFRVLSFGYYMGFGAGALVPSFAYITWTEIKTQPDRLSF